MPSYPCSCRRIRSARRSRRGMAWIAASSLRPMRREEFPRGRPRCRTPRSVLLHDRDRERKVVLTDQQRGGLVASLIGCCAWRRRRRETPCVRCRPPPRRPTRRCRCAPGPRTATTVLRSPARAACHKGSAASSGVLKDCCALAAGRSRAPAVAAARDAGEHAERRRVSASV